VLTAGVSPAPVIAFIIILEMIGAVANTLQLKISSIFGFCSSVLIAPEALCQPVARQVRRKYLG
jgi:hypothetical protein